MFEQLALFLMPVFEFLTVHANIGVVGAAVLAFLNWFIFHYHETKLMDYDYYMDNIHFTAYFCQPTYNVYKTISKGFPPFGFFVVFYSIVTLFNTEQFMNTFAIKGKFNPFMIIKHKSKRQFSKPVPLKTK